MKMRADPLLVAVALGLLNPSVFTAADPLGEATPPPMLPAAAPSAAPSEAPSVAQSATRPRASRPR
jgi:hypothetical protein